MLVSVLVPAGAAEGGVIDAVARTAWTVGAQTHPGWEMLVTIESRAAGALAAGLAGQPVPSPWRFRTLPIAAGTSRAAQLAAAAEEAAGSWLTVLDPGDQYVPHTLEALLAATAPDTDLVYGDEVDPDHPDGPYRKPEWSPTFLLGHPYPGRPALLRADAVAAAGGFDPNAGAAVEWDLLLRVGALARDVRRVPRLLAQTQVWGPDGWDDAARADTRRMLERHLDRIAMPSRVDVLDAPWQCRVTPDVLGAPSVSIVIPTAGARREIRGDTVELVVQVLRSVAANTAGIDWRPVVVLGDREPDGLRDHIIAAVHDAVRATGNTGTTGTTAGAHGAAGHAVQFVTCGGSFNFASAINAGVLAADGDFVLLLNDDVEILEPAWLTDLLGWAQQPGVGAVGAKLLFEDGTVQHDGVCLNLEDLPTHVHVFQADGPGYHGSLQIPSERLAVTAACLLVRRASYLEVGGLCTDFPLNFNDVDFCLKLRKVGLRSLVVPSARLTHFESSTRSPTLTTTETALYQQLWGHLDRDPYFDIRHRVD